MKSSKRYGSKIQLYTLKNGDISYYIVYNINSKTIYKKVGKKSEGITERKAFELRNKIISSNRHGIDMSQKSSRAITFDNLACIYFESNEHHNKSNKKYFQMYKKHIKQSIGDVAVARLDDSLIYELQALKKAGIKEPQKELAKLGITKEGNFDGVASNPYFVEEAHPKVLKILRQIRQKRLYPFIDKKIITAWNALYIEAKLRASIVEDRYKKEALNSLERLLKVMWQGKLYHQKFGTNPPSKEAMLEDYAFLLRALTTAYEVSLDERYLHRAHKIFDETRERFFDKGVWYFSRLDHNLSAPLDDSYYSSALATLYHGMLDLAILEEDHKIFRFAKRSIDEKSALIFHSPASFPTATRAVFRLKIGDVALKASKKRLKPLLKEIASIRYPYVHPKATKSKEFIACTLQSCFAQSKDFSTIKQKIEERLEPKKIGWGDGKR